MIINKGTNPTMKTLTKSSIFAKISMTHQKLHHHKQNPTLKTNKNKILIKPPYLLRQKLSREIWFLFIFLQDIPCIEQKYEDGESKERDNVKCDCIRGSFSWERSGS